MNCQVIFLLIVLSVGLVSCNCPVNLVIKSGDATIAALNKELKYDEEEIISYGAGSNLRIHCNEENGVGANLIEEACTESNCLDNISNCAELTINADNTLSCTSQKR